ncbi:MAG: hypothetical protein K5686_10380 [Lachnospiraceae bacterium]|nr:hypothetical protein [Lachnospiraceae bacterium]
MDNFMDKLAEKYNAQDMIKANSQAETAQMQSLQEQVESYETVLQEMRKLNYKNSELTEKMYALVDESLEKVRTLQIEAKEGGATPEAASIEMSEAVGRAVSEAVDSMDLSGIKDQLFEIRQSNTNTEESLNAVAAAVASMQGLGGAGAANDEVLEAIKDADSSLRDQMNAIAAAIQQLPTSVVSETREISSSTDISDIDETLKELKDCIGKLESSLGSVGDGIASVKDSVGSLNDRLGGIDDTVREIKEKEPAAQEVTVSGPAEAPEEVMESLSALTQSGARTREILAEIKSSLAELGEVQKESAAAEAPTPVDYTPAFEELNLSLRTLRSATDENRNSIKSALDSATYGIKQDNREIVGVLQRLNSTISTNFDPILKEEEERTRTEADRKYLEDRMKQTEDFMHKESVKVYRNVQAVLNEQSEKQTESLEEAIKKIANGVSAVKKIAIVSMILGMADLAVLILYICGIFK